MLNSEKRLALKGYHTRYPTVHWTPAPPKTVVERLEELKKLLNK